MLTWSFRCTILIVFAKGGLKLSFKALGGHTNCYSELRILISCRHRCPKFSFASKAGGQARLLTWSFRCTILIVFAKWTPKAVAQSLRWPQKLLFLAKDSYWLPSCDTKILIRIEKWWSNSGVDLVVSLHHSHCLCKWRPQRVVQYPSVAPKLLF